MTTGELKTMVDLTESVCSAVRTAVMLANILAPPDELTEDAKRLRGSPEAIEVLFRELKRHLDGSVDVLFKARSHPVHFRARDMASRVYRAIDYCLNPGNYWSIPGGLPPGLRLVGPWEAEMKSDLRETRQLDVEQLIDLVRDEASVTTAEPPAAPGERQDAAVRPLDGAVDSKAQGNRFRVALSFPGEHRPFVVQVAAVLADHLGQRGVFYDKYYEAELARPNLDTYLQQVYHDDSDLIAVFLCAEYEKKDWCGLEWRAIRDLIKKRDGAAIMPFRFDATTIPGLFSIDGYVEIGKRTPREIASLILERLQHNDHSNPGTI